MILPKPRLLVLAVLAASLPTFAQSGAKPFDPVPTLSQYDVTWTEPGRGPDDSMPIGNGDLGLNVWTEPNGDLVFYIGKSDAWTEVPSGSYGLAKIAGLRVSLEPRPAVLPTFSQTLHLHTSDITIREGVTLLRIWADANHPAIHVEATSPQPVKMRVQLIDWRERPPVNPAEGGPDPEDISPWRSLPDGRITADTIESVPNALEWFHHNGPKSDIHVGKYTWGARVTGPSLVGTGKELISSHAAQSQQFTAVVLTSTEGSESAWQHNIRDLASTVAAQPLQAAWKAHASWWDEFWHRSWIFLDGDSDAQPVTQGYVLQRYVTAAAGRGAHAIKFNGSLFVVDNPSASVGRDANKKDIMAAVSADFRSWGGQYWFQNTRPMYWPMLAAGDFDLMHPLFHQYLGEIRSNEASVRQYYHHDGSYFAETSPWWGNINNYPFDKPGMYTDFYFTPVLELSMMMLDYFADTADKAFVRDTLLPIASQGVTFFAQHWPHDADGKLLLDPDNSIEMYWKVHNPAPDIAGLQAVLPRLIALPADLTSPIQRTQWQTLLSQLPPLPEGDRNGTRILLPYTGSQTQPSHNSENPELYAIYPFRLFGVGKPELDLAKASFDARLIKTTGCWVQDPIQAAYLGLTEPAKKDVTFDLTRKDKRLKFPAFWDPGHDYLPDEDNGGNGQNGLQLMLMQTEGKRILLLPAWPSDWNADFKLHAPMQTTIEGRVENGQIVRLTVTPAPRRADVEIAAHTKPMYE